MYSSTTKNECDCQMYEENKKMSFGVNEVDSSSCSILSILCIFLVSAGGSKLMKRICVSVSVSIKSSMKTGTACALRDYVSFFPDIFLWT